MKKFTLATAALSVAAASAFAQCMMLEAPLSDRVQASQTIFEGKVIGKSSFWNAEHTNIYTSNTVEVYKVFKGNHIFPVAEIITPGGIVGTSMELVNPSLELTEGQTGIFLVNQSEIPSPASLPQALVYNATYGPQAFIKYDLVDASASDVFHSYNDIQGDVYAALENQTGNHYTAIKKFDVNESKAKVNPSAMAPSISGFTPATITAGTTSTLTINGTGFGTNTGSAKVEFKNADDGGASYVAALPTHIASWSATQIKVVVPSKTGTGTIRVTDNAGATGTSSGSVAMTYGQITAVSSGVEYRLELANKNTSGGYTFKYCTAFNSNTAAVAAFDRALMTWKCATNVNFIASGTTANVCNAKDGTCIVNFDGGCALGGNLLGITNSYFDACSQSGTWYWTLTEMDIRFAAAAGGGTWNYGPAATTGGKYDFESTALHELAHAHLEAHVINPPELMHWSRSANVDVRTLNASIDIACGNEALNRSTGANNPCGATAHSKLTPSGCSGTGVFSHTAENAISVFPNPFSGSTVLRVPSVFLTSGNTVSLGVYDVMGNEVHSQNIQSEEVVLDASAFSSGVYFFRIKNGDAVIDSGKLVVTKE